MFYVPFSKVISFPFLIKSFIFASNNHILVTCLLNLISEKFHLFKKPNIVFKVLAVVSLLFIVFYIVDYFQTKEFKTTFFTGVFLQTMIFFLMVSINNRKNNYYIEFFDDEIILNYLKYKKKRIAFEDIEDIKVKMFEVELTLKNEEIPVLINLDNALDDVVKGVKDRFKEIAKRFDL